MKTMSIKALDSNQKRYLAGLLELACQQLELTASQYEDAKSKYEAISNWLAESPQFKLAKSSIFPHGSVPLGTTVRPLGRDQFDIDLICHLIYATATDHPNMVRNLVGERLREHDTYEKMLYPLNRGWRLNYAESSKFHLDITPQGFAAAQHRAALRRMRSVRTPSVHRHSHRPRSCAAMSALSVGGFRTARSRPGMCQVDRPV
jgi:hypothetical protein